jgi:hypothetical protein
LAQFAAPGTGAVRLGQQGPEPKLSTLARSEGGRGQVTVAPYGQHDPSLSGHGQLRVGIREGLEQPSKPIIVLTPLDGERALPGCRDAALGIEDLGHRLHESHSLEPRFRQHHPVDHALLATPQASVDVTAKRLEHQVWSQQTKLNLSA